MATEIPDSLAFPEALDGGRSYTTTRAVRLSDTWSDGRLRLDAVARYLQDVGSDDMADAGFGDTLWVLRRTAIRLDGRPRLHDVLTLTTYCSALGTRWARRSTTIVGADCRMETVAFWLHIDATSARAATIPAAMRAAYEKAAGGRKASGRLLLGPPPDTGTRSQPWPTRTTDLDVLGHVNNAVYWEAFDTDSLELGDAVVEYQTPIGPDDAVNLIATEDRRQLWLASSSGVHASARFDPR